MSVLKWEFITVYMLFTRTLSQGQNQGLGTKAKATALCPQGTSRTRPSPQGHMPQCPMLLVTPVHATMCSWIDTYWNARWLAVRPSVPAQLSV